MATLQMETNLYHVLEKILSAEHTTPDRAITCNELIDLPRVKKLTNDANRVSDALGTLWRRGYLSRVPAPKTPNSQAKWAYLWGSDTASKVVTPVNFAQAAAPSSMRASSPILSHNTLLAKPEILITEEGNQITIELPNLRITITGK